MLNDNDTSSHPSSAKFLRCSRSCSAFGRPSVPDRSQMSTAYSISGMASSVRIVPSLRFLSRSGSAAWVVSLRASQRRHFDDGVCSCGPGARRNLARAGGVPRGAILATRGRDGSTAVVPGAGTPPSCPAWAARPWRQLAAWLPLAGCRRAPRRGNIWLHGPTTSGHAQRSSFGGGSHRGSAALSGGGGSGVGLGPEPRLKALLTRATVHRLADRPRRQSAGRNTDPLARRRLGPSRGRRIGVGNPVRRPPGPDRRAHGPDPRADLGASDLFRVGGHLRRRLCLDWQR
jgi:hypothetical protein